MLQQKQQLQRNFACGILVFREKEAKSLKQIVTYLKSEAVLSVAALCAALTMLLVPPDKAYIGYIDFRVLGLLFALMTLVEGFRRCGVFRALTAVILRRAVSGRVLGLLLVALPFFSAMLVTNDVALLVFVPFTLGLLEDLGCRRAAVPLLVLQTIAANLGSMATPVGNPQNLYLYSRYELAAGEFFAVVLPLTALSMLALGVLSFFVLPKTLPNFVPERFSLTSQRALAVFGLLFVLALLSVFRLLPWEALVLLVIAASLLLDKELLRRADYALLLTFVCFFIVSGNLGRMETIRTFVQGLLDKNALLASVLVSQVISNVPAAVLLSGFTENWAALLAGVNIGGLGTPIASLASLITLKLYLKSDQAQPGRFLLIFTAANLAFLALLLIFP